MVIENHYIQTSLMVVLSLFRGKEGGPTFINQRWTLYIYIHIYITITGDLMGMYGFA